jgi:histone acetyltransferase 1
MQLFILLYIEAGSYLQEDEDQWEFVILCASHILAIRSSYLYRFERRKRKDNQYVYHFVGYSSLYPFYYYPNSTRMRLRCFYPFWHVTIPNPSAVSL